MDRPTTANTGAVPDFYGREEELAWLYGLLEDVATTGIPRLAVIVAESGIGKTALVQALYRKLTTDARWDGPSPGGFWPDAFQGSDDGLKVNPDFPESYHPREPPKFMWLGLRWYSSEVRNRFEQSCPAARSSRGAVPSCQGGGGHGPSHDGISGPLLFPGLARGIPR